MDTTANRTDPVGTLAARFAVFGLLGLALWANVYPMERPAAAQTDPGIIIQIATPTPSLPTPALAAPIVDMAQPTPEPEALPAPIAVESPAALPAPIWSAADLAYVPEAPATSVTSPDAAPAPEADPSAYLDNVGAQAAHSPRGDVSDPPMSQTGPILMPAVDDQPAYIVAPVGSDAAPAPAAPMIAAAVPPISDAQAAVLADRESNTCAPGQVFYPRTGCHTPGSGGKMPGAVGESRP